MKCPRCGNEVSQDEAFCGQCGTPIMPPARPTEMVNTSAPRSGQLNSYQANMPSPPGIYNSGMLPPPTSYNPAIPVPPGSSMAPNAPIVKPSTPQQSSGFYQDATEAMSSLPGNNGYPMGYPQRNFPGVSMHGGYSGARQYGPQMQPFQTGNFAGPGYSSPTGQDYGMPARLTPPQKPQTSAILVIASVCLIIALFVFIGIGALYLLRGHSPARTFPTPLPAATSVPTIAPTAIPTPMPTPSPTVASTPTPDPGFLWCGQQCTTNGFSVEYPNTWQLGSTPDATGIQFTDPSPPDVYAAFKTPGATTNNAGTLVNTDLQTNFASKPGYTPPTASATTTIGGENWTYAIAHYQLNNQMERIEVFATVHQGKAYIIELQAPDSQFDAVNSQYFEMMLGRFQFLQSAQQ